MKTAGRALVIGIDHYQDSPLSGCVNDALAVKRLLETHANGDPNFSVMALTSDSQVVTTALMFDAVTQLFKGDADTVVLYFAGHGLINEETNAGFLLSQNHAKGAWGVALGDVLELANKAYPHVKSTVIILDSCHSGFAGEVPQLGSRGQVSVIGTGVTILTACHRDGLADEDGQHGLFTGLLLEGLTGSASDVRGYVTPAALYSLIDQTLGEWEQRPIYKANVQTFVTLRQVPAKIPSEVLRRLPEYFPTANYIYPLDPSYEPDRENIPEHLRNLPVDPEHVAIFKELQMCNRQGLIAPVEAEHMYYAAIDSKGCKLTALGAHYRKLANLKRI
ncbi:MULTISPECIES: caspase family protein [unclassified Bradyrhizobium]|uniref:caspase family protein n=1 Tax=unclassified Bradyrhizobium TaxID=2631580 RepID=UPI001FFB0BD4|nr:MULTISPECIES: caspase family protein [unclassified Bradyrhizobium]MCK1707723.1 caspase family protein [Bradyrhizobium sp. 143]MCK1730024.1 caspase family protein [Bradyrhizobium sp. 142]UPJ68585.1 caspase family protein [Bradyrhizobium sp. 191]